MYDKKQEKIISTLSGHKKKITDVSFVPSEDKQLVLVCSEDQTATLFNFSTAKGKADYKIKHNGSINACDIHPLGYLAVLASSDETFSFHDLNQKIELKSV